MGGHISAEKKLSTFLYLITQKTQGKSILLLERFGLGQSEQILVAQDFGSGMRQEALATKRILLGVDVDGAGVFEKTVAQQFLEMR